MKYWLRRAGGPALIPVLGLFLCLGFIPFATDPADSAPVPVAVQAAPTPAEPAPTPEPVPTSRCVDDGTSGKRVMALYVRGDEQSGRFSRYEKRFRSWLDEVDRAFVRSARINGGGWRQVRWVRDAQCRQVIDDVTIPQAAMEDTGTITSALRTMGYDRTDRKYVVWYDQPGCGLAFGAGGNDLPDWYNLYEYGPHYATIGTECWSWSTTLHELLHTLGAINDSAPHSTVSGHCWDDADVMCYDDGDLPEHGLRKVCRIPAKAKESGLASNLIDCNGDDYFHTDPAPGSYLDTHWNVANSSFLYAQRPGEGLIQGASGVQAESR